MSAVAKSSDFRLGVKNSNAKFGTTYVGTKIIRYPCFGWSPLYHTCSSWEAKIAKFYKSVPIGTLLSKCTDRYTFLGLSTKATNSSVTMYTLIKVYRSVHFDNSVPASKSVRDSCYISCPTLEITHRACCTSTHTPPPPTGAHLGLFWRETKSLTRKTPTRHSAGKM